MTNIAEKLTAVAENQQKLFDAGKKAEYDAFWDAYQQNGNADGYEGAFAGQRWNSENWKPKYPITLNNATYLSSYRSAFQYFDRGCKKPSLELHEGDIDFTYAMNMLDMFANSNISVVEMNAIPDGGTKHDMTRTFISSDITFRKLTTVKLGVSAKTTFFQTFNHANALKHVSFVEGSVIAKSGVDLQFSPALTRESLENIVSVLSPETSGLSITFALSAVNNAFETSDGARDGASSPAWETLIATKSNWTISLM